MSKKTEINDTNNVGLLALETITFGGIQSFMLRVVEVFAGLIQENLVETGICFSLNESTQALRENLSIPTIINVLGGDRSKLKFIFHVLQFKSNINTLIVGHIHLAPLAFVLKVFGKINKYYVILHGIEAWNHNSFFERRALLDADGIIATTNYTAQENARSNDIPISHFHVIPLCVNELAATPAAGFKLKGAFKLLCVARQDASEQYKGFEQLFHAMVLLKKNLSGLHLNLVGRGDDQARLKGIACELGIDENVTFWGGLPDEELAAAYQDCDVFVMPSKKEGFGIVFLEAMRFGKPCIGGNHGGTPDVIEHGQSGFLVEYDHVSALAGYIRVLAEDASLCIKMGKRGQELVGSKFNFQSFSSGYSSIIFRN